MSNYPAGADNDPRAPWRQKELPEVEVEVWASNTLSRAALIRVHDYKELPPDSERDEEGHVTYMRNIDFSDCNFNEAFKHQCYTVKEIFETLRMVVNDINIHGIENNNNLQLLNRLANEGELWTVDEEEVVRA